MSLKNFLNPKNLSDCFKPLLYTANIFATFPYKFTKNTLQTSETLKWLNFSLSIVCLISFDAQQFLFKDSISLSNPFQILSLIRLMNLNFLTIIHILNGPKNHRNFVQVFKKFHDLEKLYQPSKENLVKILKFSLVECFGFAFVSVISVVYAVMKDVETVEKVLYGIGFSIWMVTVASKEINFVNGMGLAGAFVTMTHDSLRSVLGNAPRHKSYSLHPDKNVKLETVKKMRQGYRQILEIKNDVNDAYSFQILSAIAYSFFEIVFLMFLIIVAFKIEPESLAESRFIFFMVFTAYIAGKLAVVIITCQRLTYNLNKTGGIICDLIAQNQDPEIEHELKMFASDLLHRDTTITANGFFTIDYSLLHSIIGAVFMYIIILFQFKLDEDNSGHCLDSPTLEDEVIDEVGTSSNRETAEKKMSPIGSMTYYGM